MAEAPSSTERQVEGGSWGHTLGRLISWAGGHAMRPQTAMAAVLLLMIGSGVVFLRARPEQGSKARVSVIERGVPGQRDELAPPAPVLATAELRLAQEHGQGLPGSAPATSSRREASKTATKDSDPYTSAVALYESGQYAAAIRKLDTLAEAKGTNAASAAFYAAKSVEAASGCEKALPRYEAVASRFADGEVAGEALLAAASCHKALGQPDKARDIYVALRQLPAFSDRAEQALGSLDAQAASSPPEELTPPETPPSASP